MAVAERIDVADARERERYELSMDGEIVGYTAYRARPGLIAFVHTEVDERLQGRGLADRLIRFALQDARTRGLTALPFCAEALAAVIRRCPTGALHYCHGSGPCRQWEYEPGRRRSAVHRATGIPPR